MLVSSFDTKYSQTATKYEYLDNNFTNLLSKDRRFSRIFTSVIENQKLVGQISRKDIVISAINMQSQTWFK